MSTSHVFTRIVYLKDIFAFIHCRADVERVLSLRLVNSAFDETVCAYATELWANNVTPMIARPRMLKCVSALSAQQQQQQQQDHHPQCRMLWLLDMLVNKARIVPDVDAFLFQREPIFETRQSLFNLPVARFNTTKNHDATRDTTLLVEAAMHLQVEMVKALASPELFGADVNVLMLKQKEMETTRIQIAHSEQDLLRFQQQQLQRQTRAAPRGAAAPAASATPPAAVPAAKKAPSKVPPPPGSKTFGGRRPASKTIPSAPPRLTASDAASRSFIGAHHLFQIVMEFRHKFASKDDTETSHLSPAAVAAKQRNDVLACIASVYDPVSDGKKFFRGSLHHWRRTECPPVSSRLGQWETFVADTLLQLVPLAGHPSTGRGGDGIPRHIADFGESIETQIDALRKFLDDNKIAGPPSLCNNNSGAVPAKTAEPIEEIEMGKKKPDHSLLVCLLGVDRWYVPPSCASPLLNAAAAPSSPSYLAHSLPAQSFADLLSMIKTLLELGAIDYRVRDMSAISGESSKRVNALICTVDGMFYEERRRAVAASKMEGGSNAQQQQHQDYENYRQFRLQAMRLLLQNSSALDITSSSASSPPTAARNAYVLGAVDSRHETLLHIACRNQDLAAVELLLEFAPELVRIGDCSGRTALGQHVQRCATDETGLGSAAADELAEVDRRIVERILQTDEALLARFREVCNGGGGGDAEEEQELAAHLAEYCGGEDNSNNNTNNEDAAAAASAGSSCISVVDLRSIDGLTPVEQAVASGASIELTRMLLAHSSLTKKNNNNDESHNNSVDKLACLTLEFLLRQLFHRSTSTCIFAFQTTDAFKSVVRKWNHLLQTGIRRRPCRAWRTEYGQEFVAAEMVARLREVLRVKHVNDNVDKYGSAMQRMNNELLSELEELIVM